MAAWKMASPAFRTISTSWRPGRARARACGWSRPNSSATTNASARWRNLASRRGTIFCDIDGTLIVHEDRPDYSRLPHLLPGSREKLRNWIAEGYLCRAVHRARQEDEPRLAEMLRELDIPYHRFVSGLPSGMRILINDRKPHAMFATQAASLEIARDKGIAALEILPGRKPGSAAALSRRLLRRNPAGGGSRAAIRAQARRQERQSGIGLSPPARPVPHPGAFRTAGAGPGARRFWARRTIPTNISMTWNSSTITASSPIAAPPRRRRRWTGCSTISTAISIASSQCDRRRRGLVPPSSGGQDRSQDRGAARTCGAASVPGRRWRGNRRRCRPILARLLAHCSGQAVWRNSRRSSCHWCMAI